MSYLSMAVVSQRKIHSALSVSSRREGHVTVQILMKNGQNDEILANLSKKKRFERQIWVKKKYASSSTYSPASSSSKSCSWVVSLDLFFGEKNVKNVKL